MKTAIQQIFPFYVRGWGTNQMVGATNLKRDSVRIAARELGRINPQAYSHHARSRTYLGSPNIYPKAAILIDEAERFCEI